MSEESFPARWSRRKQAAKDGRAAPQRAPSADGEPPPGEPAAAPAPDAADLARLPPIDAIDAATDITAFLRQGIPPELSRAALRRAWSADPAIRDFIGPAENAWDFTDPAAMPGFGPLDLTAGQVDALVRRVIGHLAQAVDEAGGRSSPAVDDRAPSAPAESAMAQASEAGVATAPVRHDAPDAGPSTADMPADTVAPQSLAGPDAAAPARRRHGGALPREP